MNLLKEILFSFVACVMADVGPIVSRQKFGLRQERSIGSADVVNTMTVASALQCAIVCQSTTNCEAFNVNRCEAITDCRQLQCQALSGRTESIVTNNDLFDNYQSESTHSNQEAITVGTTVASPMNPVTQMPTATTATTTTTTTTKSVDCPFLTYSLNEAVLSYSKTNATVGPANTQNKQDSCKLVASTINKNISCTFWIGLQSKPLGNSFQWYWLAGPQYAFSYSNWAIGEPPEVPEINTQVFYVYANCTTGKWWTTTNQYTCRNACTYPKQE